MSNTSLLMNRRCPVLNTTQSWLSVVNNTDTTYQMRTYLLSNLWKLILTDTEPAWNRTYLIIYLSNTEINLIMNWSDTGLTVTDINLIWYWTDQIPTWLVRCRTFQIPNFSDTELPVIWCWEGRTLASQKRPYTQKDLPLIPGRSVLLPLLPKVERQVRNHARKTTGMLGDGIRAERGGGRGFKQSQTEKGPLNPSFPLKFEKNYVQLEVTILCCCFLPLYEKKKISHQLASWSNRIKPNNSLS